MTIIGGSTKTLLFYASTSEIRLSHSHSHSRSPLSAYWETDFIVFEHCHIEKNETGISTQGIFTAYSIATFKHCNITKNTLIDVEYAYYTLMFEKVKYDTYDNWQNTGLLIEN
jgi:hypothetical protein